MMMLQAVGDPDSLHHDPADPVLPPVILAGTMIRSVLIVIWLSTGTATPLPHDGTCVRCASGGSVTASLAIPRSIAMAVPQASQSAQAVEDDEQPTAPSLMVVIAQLAVGVALCFWGFFHLNHQRKVIGTMLLVTGGLVFSAWPLVFWLW
jgi:hypothetical protein